VAACHSGCVVVYRSRNPELRLSFARNLGVTCEVY
jgi:hypothetical protein